MSSSSTSSPIPRPWTPLSVSSPRLNSPRCGSPMSCCSSESLSPRKLETLGPPSAETLVSNIAEKAMKNIKTKLSDDEMTQFMNACKNSTVLDQLQSALIQAFTSGQPQWINGIFPRSLLITGNCEPYLIHNRKEHLIARGNYTRIFPADNLMTGEDASYRSTTEPVQLAKKGYNRALRLQENGSEPIEASMLEKVKADGSTRVISLEKRWDGDITDPMEFGMVDTTSLNEFLEFAIPMTETLNAVHELNIIHGDVKPGNYIFKFDKETATFDIRICDLAHASKQGKVNPFRFIGTQVYWSPEYHVEFIKAKQGKEFNIDLVTTKEHDGWQLGICLLTYCVENEDENCFLNSFISQNPQLKQLLELWSAPLDIKPFLDPSEPDEETRIKKATAAAKDADIAKISHFISQLQPGWIQEPEQGTFEYVLWKLLQVDPKERWTPETALGLLEKLRGTG